MNTTLVWGSILVENVPIKEKLSSEHDVWKGYSSDIEGRRWIMFEEYEDAGLYVISFDNFKQ